MLKLRGIRVNPRVKNVERMVKPLDLDSSGLNTKSQKIVMKMLMRNWQL